jgi:hypothetical protein
MWGAHHSTIVTITFSEVYVSHLPVSCLHSYIFRLYWLRDNLRRKFKRIRLEPGKVLQAKLPRWAKTSLFNYLKQCNNYLKQLQKWKTKQVHLFKSNTDLQYQQQCK